jgi:hypothetical protein
MITIFNTTVMILLMIIGIALTIRILIMISKWFLVDLKELIDNIKRLRNKDK